MPEFSVDQMKNLLVAAVILVVVCVFLAFLMKARSTNCATANKRSIKVPNDNKIANPDNVATGPTTWTKLNFIHSSYKLMNSV